jgi:dipeptidyl aminopeptidase/acylaminoacyl peptidase
MRIFCLLFAFALLNAQPTISTFAGLPPAEGRALGLDYGLATPSGLAEDSAGNVYFAAGNIIYKVTPAGDAIRYAGTGWANGATADGFPARDTRLFRPQDPKFGPDGNLYFVETGNFNAIRVVDSSTGMVRTVYAPATLVQFDFDSDGRLLIAARTPTSTGIYRVAPQTQALTLVADFSRLGSFAVEPVTGDLYVLSDLYQITKLTRSTGAVSDVSPNRSTEMFKVRALGGGELLLIGDFVRRYSTNSRTVTPIAGAFDVFEPIDGGLSSESGFQFVDALPRTGSSDYLINATGA